MNYFKLTDHQVNSRILLLLIIVAYSLSIALRYYWIYYADSIAAFKFNDEIIINNGDGFAYAKGALQYLAGETSSYSNHPLSIITAFFYSILPFKLETLILYLPGYFGALLVIPMILIGHYLKQSYIGFFAGLFASITWSYYNRTMFGYFDTDALTIFFPMLGFAFLLIALQTKKPFWCFLTGLIFNLYFWYYASGGSVIIALAIMLILYSLIFDRKQYFNYFLASFLIISVIPLQNFLSNGILILSIKTILDIALLSLAYQNKINIKQYSYFIILTCLVFYIILGGYENVLGALRSYVFDKVSSQSNDMHFVNVAKTVREASAIDFDFFANRISGHQVSFFLSMLGIILLLINFRLLLLLLPMLFLGFLAYKFGLRFTIYAVPLAAFGLVYLIFFCTQFISHLIIRIIVIILLFTAAIAPNIYHIYNYKTPSSLQANEVQALTTLNKLANKQDYALTWWDYGFPLMFYSDLKVFADGAKHAGSRVFPLSYILTNQDQVSSANLARIMAEYDEFYGTKENPIEGDIIQKGMTLFNYDDPYDFLESLSDEYFLYEHNVSKTKEVFFYLPMRMMNIFPTVESFQNMDLSTGVSRPNSLYIIDNNFREQGDWIFLANGIKFNKHSGLINLRSGSGVKEFNIINYNNSHNNKTAIKRTMTYSQYYNSDFSMTYLPLYMKFLLLDERAKNSLFMQLFVFENYDTDLFEKVFDNKLVKIFKLKI